MKNIKYLFILVTIFSIVSCSNSPIYSTIEKEIVLKDPNIKGIVESIVIAKDNLYITNGNLYKKTNGKGEWQTIDFPLNSCQKLASDGNVLYGLFTSNDGKTSEVYYLEENSWKKTNLDKPVFLIGDKTVFAFTTKEETYKAFTLNKEDATEIASELSTPIDASGDYFITTTKIYDYVGNAIEDSNAPTKDISAIATNNSNLYVATGTKDSEKVYFFDGTDWKNKSHKISNPKSLCYFSNEDNEIILIGGYNGYGEITIKEDSNLGEYQTPGSSNISSIKPESESQYNSSVGLHTAHKMFYYKTIIYIGVVDAKTKSSGLWAYDPKRAVWDRE